MTHIDRMTLTLAAAALLAGRALPATAQSAPRLWAAQTGPDQVSLVWDSIPGTTEYRIYLGPVGKVDEHRPDRRLSASARRTEIFGIQRVSQGMYLLAADASGRALQRAPFNPVTPATSASQLTAPDEVTAEATSAFEVTLSWTPVPGATAYSILRAVSPGGLVQLCALCSTDTHYVDESVAPGFPHTYAVAAIFPQGSSRRTASNQVTPGATQATTTAQTPATSSTTTTATGTTTHTATPVSQPPTTSTPTGGLVGAVQGAVQSAVGGVGNVLNSVQTVMSGVAVPTGVSAVATGPGAARVTWTPSVTPGITEYRIERRVNASPIELVGNVGPGVTAYADAFFPATLFAGGPVSVTYRISAGKSGTYGPAATSSAVTVSAPAASTGAPAAGSAATSCKLDYQRADNMWAAFGRPDGPLGTETLSLATGQDKVFVTDWKYEKQRNDGTNYYGSHLRVATNSSSRPIRLQVRLLTSTSWIRLDPGKTQQFQADLMEVFCD